MCLPSSARVMAHWFAHLIICVYGRKFRGPEAGRCHPRQRQKSLHQFYSSSWRIRSSQKKSKTQLAEEQKELERREIQVISNEDAGSIAVNLDQEHDELGSIMNSKDNIGKKKHVSFPDDQANHMPNESDEDTSNMPLATIFNSDIS